MQIAVPLAFRVRLACGQRSERLREQFDRLDVHGNLAGPGAEHVSRYPDVVAEVEQLDQGVRVFTDGVPLRVHLHRS